MFWDSLLGWFSVDMGIDLGTCNTLVCVRNEGIVLKSEYQETLDKARVLLAVLEPDCGEYALEVQPLPDHSEREAEVW